jgi:hypothetical protein
MELVRPRCASDFGGVGIQIVGERVELFLPMRDAVPRLQYTRYSAKEERAGGDIG